MSNFNSADIDAINRLNEQANAAWEAGDVESFLDIFTDDVVWLPPGQPDVFGKEACRSWAQGALDRSTYEQVTKPSEEVVVASDWAFDRFRVSWVSTPRAGGEAKQTDFRGFHILRRQVDGSWKVVRYIWN